MLFLDLRMCFSDKLCLKCKILHKTLATLNNTVPREDASSQSPSLQAPPGWTCSSQTLDPRESHFCMLATKVGSQTLDDNNFDHETVSTESKVHLHLPLHKHLHIHLYLHL